MLGLEQFKAVSSFTTGTMWDVRRIISSLQVQSSLTTRMAKTTDKEVHMSSDLWCSRWSRLCALERDNNLNLSSDIFCSYHPSKPFSLSSTFLLPFFLLPLVAPSLCQSSQLHEVTSGPQMGVVLSLGDCDLLDVVDSSSLQS